MRVCKKCKKVMEDCGCDGLQGTEWAMRIVMKRKTFKVDEKRFSFPAIIEAGCPKCSMLVKRDLEEFMLGHPDANKPMKIGMYCDQNDCGHEWDVKVLLRITLEMA